MSTRFDANTGTCYVSAARLHLQIITQLLIAGLRAAATYSHCLVMLLSYLNSQGL